MNKIALAVAVAAMAVFAGSEASAQNFNTGFQFGAGVRAAGHAGFCQNGVGFFGRSVQRQVRPPYFAEFPPVYYNGIVRRPYGISPYAAPAGVAPIELQYGVEKAEPITVANPFFNNRAAASASEIVEEQVEASENKSTSITNEYFDNVPESNGLVLPASFEEETDT